MAKHCETFEHTADIGLAATASTLGELFEALAEGLADLICPTGRVAPKESRRLSVRSEDIEALAVDFLSEVMVAIQTEHFAVASVKVHRIDNTAVEAEIFGEPFDGNRHRFHTEVKAVTYHQLCVVRQDNQWVGRVILDI